MLVKSLKSWWSRTLTPINNRAVLRVEELELIVAPATFRLAGGGGSASWTDEHSWQIYDDVDQQWQAAPEGETPGKNRTTDDVEFWGKDGTTILGGTVLLNQSITLHRVLFKPSSGSRILFTDGAALTLSGTNWISGIEMEGGAALSGWAAGRNVGKVNLEGKASLNMRNGALEYMQINIARGATAAASMNLIGQQGAQPTLWGTEINVAGTLSWANADVRCWTMNSVGLGNTIRVQPGGVFNIGASTKTFGTGNPALDPNALSIINQSGGKVVVNSTGTATLVANYTTEGQTTIEKGTLYIHGSATQTAGQFELRDTITLAAAPTLTIRGGTLIGSGTINGNLVLGYGGANEPNTTPILSPGGGNSPGTIRVNGNFHLFSGKLDFEIYGPDPAQNDLLQITGNAAIAGPAGRLRQANGRLMPAHADIPAGTLIAFMTYATANGMEAFNSFPFDPAGSWSNDHDPTKYWVMPLETFTRAKGKVGGTVWTDGGAVAGVREAGEGGMAGVTVRLLDEAGVNQIASTVTDANGNYLFEDLAAGIYIAEFVRPANMRFAAARIGAPSTDSDPDPGTGRVRVVVYGDVANLDAGLYSNTAPAAASDTTVAHRNTATVGTVRANDTDADGDQLTYAVVTGPSHGTLALNPDGTFTYTPHTNYTGPDSFMYQVSDGYGGTATATVSITLAGTSAPVGTTDSYSAAAGLSVDAAGGVLSNDTNPNGGLSAVLARGPQHGALVLHADGSFTYTVADGFVGTDSFTYRPTDGDGPGLETTVYLNVTDHPPEAEDDETQTDEDQAVTISVLGNDSDPDNDAVTILSASDGLFGTVVVNPDGTITYTPRANWSGTDRFVYVIDDGHGRLAWATATVTVAPVNDAPIRTAVVPVVQRDAPRDIDLRTLVTDVETAPENLTFTVSNGVNGTIQLLADGFTARFTPNAGYYGAASFSLSVTDTGDGTSSTATFSGTVSVSVNAPPSASDGAAMVHLAPGESATAFASWSDPDGDPLTVTFTQPAYGSVALNAAGTGFVYTAGAPVHVGPVTFGYTVSDGRGGTATGTVTITLVNEPPTGSNLEMDASGYRALRITAPYGDPDGDPVTITQVVQPADGTVTIDPHGGLLYTPPPGFTGTVTFNFTVDDGHGGTTVIYVTLNVT